MEEENVKKTEDGYDDYREDVKEWIKSNNAELMEIEESIQGLLVAFKKAKSSDFYDGIRKLDAENDMGIGFLDFLYKFMKKYEKQDDKNYREELVSYIKTNVDELKEIQERVTYLMKAYKNADSFLDGVEKLEYEYGDTHYDLARLFLACLKKFVEAGLEEDYEEEPEEEEGII